MNYTFKALTPPPHLRSFVKNFFILEYHDAAIHEDYLLPDGLPSLFYLYADDPVTVCFEKKQSHLHQGFHAAYSNTIVRFSHGRFKIAGASIFPVHFKLVSGRNLQETVNRFIRLEQQGGITSSLPDSSRLLESVKQYIMHQLPELQHDLDFFEVYQNLTRPGGYNLRIDELAAQLGYSTRHLHALSSEHFGMSPKRFVKLLRFNYALKYLYDETSHRNLSFIAHEAGYHDQSHLIRDFKSICGKTPGQIADNFSSLASKFRLF